MLRVAGIKIGHAFNFTLFQGPDVIQNRRLIGIAA